MIQIHARNLTVQHVLCHPNVITVGIQAHPASTPGHHVPIEEPDRVQDRFHQNVNVNGQASLIIILAHVRSTKP